MLMAVPVTPGERITDLRKARGWEQKDLADNSGLHRSQISRIENGKVEKLSHDILIKLAKTFHVSTDYILGLTTVRNCNLIIATILVANFDMIW